MTEGLNAKWLAKSQGSVGRPRSLTRDMVIDAAVELGLDRFSMTRVAERLGVGISTLYQYVANRDELLRLAIDRQLSAVALPRDQEQSWSDYIIEYATSLRDALAGEPHLILQVMDGGGGIERELAVTERFVEVLVARGFSVEEAVSAWRCIGAATLGAAITVCRDRAAVARNGSSDRMLRQAFAHFEPGQLPLMRQGVDAYARQMDLVEELLRPFIESIARRRGEPSPWEVKQSAKRHNRTGGKKSRTHS
ncbi:transcriptional regulator, TetR family [Sphingomonas laterariae]|uniref:Transcriptional regulator, TetR family n=1 Tax=Edaphosphingomonas laterariae TaxID=861865 RepID=A0A239HYB1_9SPHN|nr:TetR/AcrR family transcriptional regulator C-terminal domain-containing protein [Sphingomonas laterariae]SNS86231.1 transcriptional regulator, TetR family [Sphingomonas laterariae]